MLETSDKFNSVLTSYVQGLWLYPDKELNLARTFFPAVAVDTLVGNFDKYDIAPGLTPVDTTLARDNSPRRIELKKTDGFWKCDPNAIETAEWKIALLQSGHAARMRETRMKTLMSAQFASRQSAAVDAVMAATTAVSGFGNWGASTDIVSEIDTLCDNVVLGSGCKANRLLIGIEAWKVLRNHASILDRLPGLDYGLAPEALGKVLTQQGMEIVIVDSVVMLNGTMTRLLANDVIALHNKENPDLEDMSFGKEFTLCPNGPEVVSYEEHGLTQVDSLYWASDCQVTNAGALSRLVVTA